MIAFGAGEVLGCFFIGFVVDRFGSKNGATVNVGIIAVMTAVTMAFVIMNEYGVLAFVMTFLWGFQDSAVNTHC